MAEQSLTERVILLEGRVERLEQLPAELAAFRQEVNLRFDAVDARFDAVDRRFEQMDRRFEQIDRRFEQIYRRFDQIDARFELIDRRFEAVFVRLDETNHRITILHDDILAKLAIIAEGRAPRRKRR